MLLDGRNRKRACEKAGVEPRYVAFTGEDPVAFIISQNIKRRHLDESQRSAIAASTMHICRVPQATAADMLNVSTRSVASAVKVKEKAEPVVFEAVMKGMVKVSRAAEIADLSGEDQKMLVSKMPKEDIVRNHERIKKDLKRDETFKRINEQAKAAPAWPEGRYSVIYADPPTEDDFGPTKKDVEFHYPTMSWDDLKSLPVEEIATEDAVLYLWSAPHVTHKMIEIMGRWGFEYRTHIIWMKDRIGLGQWARNKHEVLLIGRRGDFPPPPTDVRPVSVIELPAGEHSEKPEGFAEMIEVWYPQASKVELFRRGEARPGWAVYGYEALVDAL
jgi:N6-adenosine-specific RNA methylase IME4